MVTHSSIARFLLLLLCWLALVSLRGFRDWFWFRLRLWRGLLELRVDLHRVVRVAALPWFLWHGRRLFRLGFLRLLLLAVVALFIAAGLFLFLRGRGLPLVVTVLRFCLDLLFRPLLHHVAVPGRI